MGVLALGACNNGTTPPTVDAGDGASDGASDAETMVRRPVFERCTIAEISAATECATLALPLDHAHPDGDTISTHVVRIRSSTPGAPQVWMLQGGPGGSGIGLMRGLDAYGTLDVLAADLYFLDHRGTGRSAVLSCAADLTTIPGAVACSRQLNENPGDLYLDHISSEESARDLATWIDATREPGRNVIAYGVSYGTFWLSRFLEFFPNKVDGAISDSLFFGPLTRGASDDHKLDLALRRVLADCSQNATCNRALGGNPVQFFRDLRTRIEAGHCSELGEPADVSHYPLFLSTSYPHWIPALATRVSRCNAQDIAAIQHMETLFADGDAPPGMLLHVPPMPSAESGPAQQAWGRRRPPQRSRQAQSHWPIWQAGPADLLEDFSPALNAHIAVNEIFPNGVNAMPGDLLMPVEDDAVLALVAAWGERSPPMQAGNPSTGIPWLFWNGTHDFQTDYDNGLAMVNGAGHALDAFPGSGHAVLVGGHFTDEHGACAVRMFNAFAADPHAQVDRSCLSTLTVPSMSENAAMAMWLFGTSTLYARAN